MSLSSGAAAAVGDGSAGIATAAGRDGGAEMGTVPGGVAAAPVGGGSAGVAAAVRGGGAGVAAAVRGGGAGTGTVPGGVAAAAVGGGGAESDPVTASLDVETFAPGELLRDRSRLTPRPRAMEKRIVTTVPNGASTASIKFFAQSIFGFTT